MKRRDLEKKLKNAGWQFLRSGGEHDIWTDGKNVEAIPRHREINERTARGKIMKKAYKVVLILDNDGYSVYVPVYDGWTQGKDLADALYMAADYIGVMGITFEDMGREIPEDVQYEAKENEIESYVAVDFTDYRKKRDNKKVKKTLTIKSWLNEAAESEGINFSSTLEEALMNKLHIDNR